jgi:hypothetical protein
MTYKFFTKSARSGHRILMDMLPMIELVSLHNQVTRKLVDMIRQENDSLYISLLSNMAAVTSHEDDFVAYTQAFYQGQPIKLI